jgi:hypothetical protein
MALLGSSISEKLAFKAGQMSQQCVAFGAAPVGFLNVKNFLSCPTASFQKLACSFQKLNSVGTFGFSKL